MTSGFTGSLWAEVVAVTLYYEPEDESFEGGYKAVTMSGVPGNVQGTGTDSAEGALKHLSSGLAAFGFNGRLLVHDATTPGHSRRYEAGTNST